MNNYKIFIDLDGVIADFASGIIQIYPDFTEERTEANKATDRIMWKSISKYQNTGGTFWYNLPLMKDALDLWGFVSQYDHEILSATGQLRFNAGPQKIQWVKERLSEAVKINLVEKSAEKAQFAAPNHILIDDKRKSIDPWIAAGGIGVLHTSAADTIEQLKVILQL